MAIYLAHKSAGKTRSGRDVSSLFHTTPAKRGYAEARGSTSQMAPTQSWQVAAAKD